MNTTSIKQVLIKNTCFSLGLFLLINLFHFSLYSQEKFYGKLTYLLTPTDTATLNLVGIDTMYVYTNDTVVRIESNTVLGKQVLIRHLEKKKSYLLLNVQGEKYAIQAGTEQKPGTLDSLNIEYKRRGKKIISGLKCKKAIVTRQDLGTPRTVFYSKKFRPDLLEVYNQLKGLPTLYYLQHNEGVFKYELINIDYQPVSRDYFGIPSDYRITSFDALMEKLKAAKPE
jgi:hypothetical protein